MQIRRRSAEAPGRPEPKSRLGDSVGMEGGCSRKNDKKGNQVGETHTNQGIDADPDELRAGGPRMRTQPLKMLTVQLLHLLARLPKEKIWADGRAEYRHQRDSVTAVEL